MLNPFSMPRNVAMRASHQLSASKSHAGTSSRPTDTQLTFFCSECSRQSPKPITARKKNRDGGRQIGFFAASAMSQPNSCYRKRKTTSRKSSFPRPRSKLQLGVWEKVRLAISEISISAMDRGHRR